MQGKKKDKQRQSRMPVSPGRPKTKLDEELIVELADLGWGFKRIASEYIRRKGEYVSHMLVRDRLADIRKRSVTGLPHRT